jgi:hypothetical protein
MYPEFPFHYPTTLLQTTESLYALRQKPLGTVRNGFGERMGNLRRGERWDRFGVKN